MWNIETVRPQAGRTAIITGANVGIGFEAALALASRGAEVIIAARNRQKAEDAIETIFKKYPDSRVSFSKLDLSRMKSVREFAGEFIGTGKKLDILINNAGIMVPPYKLTEDGFESQIGTNFLGHFLLTGLLLPAMKNVPGSRVVTLSSLAHRYGHIRFHDIHFTKGYNKMLAYSQSKLACLVFAYELQRRLEKEKYATISLGAHPGVAATALGRNMTPVLRYFFPRVGQSAKAGALPVLMAALDENLQGGEYTGPDGWNGMRGNPVITDSSRKSKDPELGKRLWEIAGEMTGLKYLS